MAAEIQRDESAMYDQVSEDNEIKDYYNYNIKVGDEEQGEDK